jgi:streptogramin lyase
MSHRRGAFVALLLGASVTLVGTGAGAQQAAYRLVDGWAQLPPGVKAWGYTIGVDVDKQDNVWVFQRCFSTDCVGERSNVPPLLEYDPSGKLIKTWGAGMFVWPHGSTIDADGNIWLTDGRAEDGKGDTVMKVSPDGRVLMTLGTPGVAGAGHDTFNGPADVAIAPNGDIFVADGHGNSRIVKFDKNGKYLMEWGEKGSMLGQFNEPHTLAFDSKGRLFVGDRMNQRIQVFDQNGRFLAVWPAIMASGIAITPDDIVLVADYQLRKGIIIARASDFSEIGVIDDALPEGVAMDSKGNIYAGETVYKNFKKFERRTAR